MYSGEVELEDFFKKVQEIEKEIEKISRLLKKLQDANKESKSVVKASAVRAIRRRMEKDIDEVKAIALTTKTELEDLERDNLTNRHKPGFGKGSGIDRSRTATTVAMKKKLKKRVFEFQALRESIQKEYQEAVKRTVFTVTGNQADEEMIERLIETGNSEHIFQKVIQEHGRGQVMDTLAEIQERHDTVREIQRKLLELQQIFLDMAVLIETQGDMLNNIESHVSSAVDHVQSGATSLQKAKKRQHHSRSWMCRAIVLLTFIIIIIVVVVLKPWS